MKKKIEFSKLLCGLILAVSGGVGIYTIIKYFSLVEYAIATGAQVIPDGTVPVAAISIIVSAFVSYCMYQFGLKNSRNKYGIDETGQPYKTSVDYQETETDEDEETDFVDFDIREVENVINEIENLKYIPTDRGGEDI